MNIFTFDNQFFQITTRHDGYYIYHQLWHELGRTPVYVWQVLPPLHEVHIACLMAIHQPKLLRPENEKWPKLGMDECCMSTYFADPQACICESCHKVLPTGMLKLQKKDSQ